jgi:hypothetical protein
MNFAVYSPVRLEEGTGFPPAAAFAFLSAELTSSFFFAVKADIADQDGRAF